MQSIAVVFVPDSIAFNSELATVVLKVPSIIFLFWCFFSICFESMRLSPTTFYLCAPMKCFSTVSTHASIFQSLRRRSSDNPNGWTEAAVGAIQLQSIAPNSCLQCPATVLLTPHAQLTGPQNGHSHSGELIYCCFTFQRCSVTSLLGIIVRFMYNYLAVELCGLTTTHIAAL